MLWNAYADMLQHVACKFGIELQQLTQGCSGNGHISFMLTRTQSERAELQTWLKIHDIMSATHYSPLHTSKAGMKYGRLAGNDVNTTSRSQRLLRLPIHHFMSIDDVTRVCSTIEEFYEHHT